MKLSKKHLLIPALVGALIGGHALLGHRLGPTEIYPPAYTTGMTNPDVTQANIKNTICSSGWTATIRPAPSYTTALKQVQIAEFNLTDKNLSDYEEDHFISLELGGNPTNSHNLWPQPYNPKIADGGARFKDQAEHYLRSEICAGRMSLQEAQREITSDWYAVYKAKVANKLGAIPDQGDPDDE